MKQARVSYSVMKTINLGNMEFAKVQVGLEVQCDRTDEALDATWEQTKEWVDAHIKEETLTWLSCRR